MPAPPTIILPDFSGEWPFKRTQNPHYNESVCIANAKWIKGFNLLHGKAQTVFDACNFPLFVSLVYPRGDLFLLRCNIDFMEWTFFLDDLGDQSDVASYRILSLGVMDVLRDPLKDRPVILTGIESMTANFWSRCLQVADPVSAKRVVESTQQTLDAICQEIDDRAHRRVRPIEDYLLLRRQTSGVVPCFHFMMLTSGLPDEVCNHPQIQSLCFGAMDLITLSNDVYSYYLERSCGIDDHNMVTVAMKEKGVDVQDAIDYIEERFNNTAKKFLEDMKDVPSFSKALDPLVSEYVWGMGNWVKGFLEWAFESGRYFGSKGLEIKSTRIVELPPRGVAGAGHDSWSIII